MKTAWLLSAFALVCACENRDTVAESASPTREELEPTKIHEVQRLIEDGLLTLDLNFRKSHGSKDEVRIECLATVTNHSDKDLVLENDLFEHYESYQIEDTTMNLPMETFADSSVNSQKRYFPLEPGEAEDFGINYEAFRCFQGTRYRDGRIEYKPSGVFEIHHRMFPGNKTTFEFTEGGVILQLIDMKEQDE